MKLTFKQYLTKLATLNEVSDDESEDRLKRIISQQAEQAKKDTKRHKERRRKSPRRKKAQQKYAAKAKAEHERKMKEDPEYRKEVEQTGKAWASYGEQRKP